MTLRCTTLALLVLYVLLTIYPIVSIAVGVAPSRFLTPVSTLAGFTFALLHAGQREGWTRALRLLALVFAVSLLFESVGVATGLVYGPYHYTNRLGPLFHGLYLFFERLTMLRGPWRLPDEWPKWRQVFSALVVFGLAALARIPFRMDLVTGWHFLARMLSPHAWTLPHLWLVQAVSTGIRGVTSWREFAFPDMRALLVLIPALLLDWKQYRRKSETFFMDWPAWAKGLFLALVVLAILLLSFGETSAPFVYQGF